MGIIRLHAVREMLRISPPLPRSFLIFTLLEELPKGDYVLEELFKSSEKEGLLHPCSAASVLKILNISNPNIPLSVAKEGYEFPGVKREKLESLEKTIGQVREESRKVVVARASLEGLKDEGISDGLLVLGVFLLYMKNFMKIC